MRILLDLLFVLIITITGQSAGINQKLQNFTFQFGILNPREGGLHPNEEHLLSLDIIETHYKHEVGLT